MKTSLPRGESGDRGGADDNQQQQQQQGQYLLPWPPTAVLQQTAANAAAAAGGGRSNPVAFAMPQVPGGIPGLGRIDASSNVPTYPSARPLHYPDPMLFASAPIGTPFVSPFQHVPMGGYLTPPLQPTPLRPMTVTYPYGVGLLSVPPGQYPNQFGQLMIGSNSVGNEPLIWNPTLGGAYAAPYPIAHTETISNAPVGEVQNSEKRRNKKRPASTSPEPPMAVNTSSNSATSSSRVSVPSRASDSLSTVSTETADHEAGNNDSETPLPRKDRVVNASCLPGERRLIIQFLSFGEWRDPIQTFGKSGVLIPHGLKGTHTVYHEKWEFEILYSDEMVSRTLVRITWILKNIATGVVHSKTETPAEARLRATVGRTLTNRLFKEAMSHRAEMLQAALAQETSVVRIANMNSLIKSLNPVRFTQGPLVWGLQHRIVQERLGVRIVEGAAAAPVEQEEEEEAS